MSAWKDSDEVTTTYGSIQLSLQQAHSAGIKTEQDRIIKLLEDEKWHQMIIQMTNPPKRTHSYGCIGCEQLALIKGETK